MKVFNSFFATIFLALMLIGCGVNEKAAEDEQSDESEPGEEIVHDDIDGEQKQEDQEEVQQSEHTESGTPEEIKQQSEEKHDAIDYTDPDFHPSEAGDNVHKTILSDDGEVDQDETLNGEYEIVYNNGFSEKGRYENGAKVGEWEVMNRDRHVVRIDVYENGQRTDFTIK